ncbi:hypothetical protein ACA910_000708 [Epithemia clementina (nom. ined.)]
MLSLCRHPLGGTNSTKSLFSTACSFRPLATLLSSNRVVLRKSHHWFSGLRSATTQSLCGRTGHHHRGFQWMSTTTTTRKSFSTASETVPPPFGEGVNTLGARTLKLLQNPFYTKPTELTTADGRKFLAFRTGHHPRLKPRLVNARIRKLRTYVGTEKTIKGSKWKLNNICQFVARLPLEEAILQLEYLKKKRSMFVRKVLIRTSNLADIRHGIQKSALEVAECYATRATPIKDIKIHGRGKFGRVEHPFCHMRVVLREIDFQLKIYQAQTVQQKKYWYTLQKRAEREAAIKTAEREEEQRLERENARKTQQLQNK